MLAVELWLWVQPPNIQFFNQNIDVGTALSQHCFLVLSQNKRQSSTKHKLILTCSGRRTVPSNDFITGLWLLMRLGFFQRFISVHSKGHFLMPRIFSVRIDKNKNYIELKRSFYENKMFFWHILIWSLNIRIFLSVEFWDVFKNKSRPTLTSLRTEIKFPFLLK